MDQGAGAVPEHPSVGAGGERGWRKPDQDMGPTLWGCWCHPGWGWSVAQAAMHPLCQQSGVRPVPSPGQW